MKISVSSTEVRGKTKWVVSYKPKGGKRKRLYLPSKAAADAEASALRLQQSRSGEVWAAMSADKRDEVTRLLFEAERDGFTLREAVELFRSHRAKANSDISLEKAVERFTKEKSGELLSKKTTRNTRSVLTRFIAQRELLPLRAITRQDALNWLKRPEWGPRTFNTYLIALKTFFNWCVEKAELLEKSPVATIDLIDKKRMPDIDAPPVVLDLDRCCALLRATLQLDPGLVPYVACCMFAGLRPEREAAKLSRIDVMRRDDGTGAIVGEILVKGLHAKDRQRRLVQVHPVLAQWLELGGDLPPKNLRKRFERVREAAGLIRIERATGRGKTRKLVDGKYRKKIVDTGWAQDCLRHTFASNYLPIYGAEKTIEQLGHGDYDMLFGHYRALISSKQAEAFWKLTPDFVRASMLSAAA